MAEKTVTFHLIIIGPDDFRARFDIPIGISIIGRHSTSEVVLENAQVSRQHARLECVADECYIADLKSANGTHINGQALTPNEPVLLKHNDQIKIGSFHLTFEQIEIAPKPEPVIEPVIGDIPPEPGPGPDGKGIVEVPLPPPPEMVPPGLSIYSQRLIHHLPGIYQTNFFSRFLGIFEAVQIPIEWIIDNFDLFLSPRTAPEEFLPWLANWFDITFDHSWTEPQRRTLLGEAHQMFARRGTRWALARVLEIYTGHLPEIDDQAKDLEPFTFRVTLPVKQEAVNRAIVEALIVTHKPLHTRYELVFQG